MKPVPLPPTLLKLKATNVLPAGLAVQKEREVVQGPVAGCVHGYQGVHHCCHHLIVPHAVEMPPPLLLLLGHAGQLRPQGH